MEKNDNKIGKFNPELISVVTTGGQHLLYMPSGEPIRCPIFTRVHDDCLDHPYVIVKVLCNLLEQKDLADYPDPYEKISELEAKVSRLERSNKQIFETKEFDRKVQNGILEMQKAKIENLEARKWYHLLFGI